MDKPIGDKPFSFADYPHIKKRMDQLFDQFKSQTSTAIRNSLEREDALSADKAADLAAYYGQALNAQRSAAVQQIANRIVGGMNLSERIWRISDSFYKEIETALDIALRDGTPADRLATELKQYLRHPDKLFRRVRDEHGQLRLSKAAQAYHPGQGIYRSSFRNARRLAVTETNMAYHAADHERWQALDFVLGYEVQVSGTNPNVCPLCMELAGKYPKEFKFVGWHPHCRCHALPILEKPQAFKARQQALLRGERIPPIGAVKAPPDNFTAHLANNTDRIASAQRNGTLPYYLRDNYKVAKDGSLTPIFRLSEASSDPQAETYPQAWRTKNLAIAKIRHNQRTDKQIETIQLQLKLRELRIQIDETDKALPKAAKWFRNGRDIGYEKDKDGFTILTPDGKRKRITKRTVIIKLSTETGVNGSTDRRGTIWITKRRGEQCCSAIKKIKAGKVDKITKNEADAMATLWHEITHNRNLITENVWLTADETMTMEMMNEFVARKTLPEFYKALGATKTPWVEFMTNRNTTGYNPMVNSYDYLINRFKLDKDKVLQTAKAGLFDGKYSKQKENAINALLEGGLKDFKRLDGENITKEQVEQLVTMCRKGLDVRSIECWLKENAILDSLTH